MTHKKLATSALAVLALLACAQSAAAQPYIVTRENPSYLTGTDGFGKVLDQLLVVLKASGDVSPDGSGGIDVYDGVGSSAGERQMEGTPFAYEDSCWPIVDPEGGHENPGCQEIAPMARALDNSICEDESAATQAEGLAVCQDGVVLLAKNAHYGQYGQSASTCTSYLAASGNNENTSNSPTSNPDFASYDGVGDWRDSGTIDLDPPGPGPEDYSIGISGFGWRDIARIVYTGFDNSDGNGAPAAGGEQNRITRCSSALRQKVVAQWSNLAEGVTCSTGPCTEVVRALRLGDSSETSEVFLEVLGLKAVLTGARSNLVSLGNCTAPVTNFTFCDGGEAEVNFPTNDPAIPGADCSGVRGDPLKKPCCADEDICDRNGQMGVVVAVRTPLENLSTSFPVNQCNRQAFARLDYQASSQPVCPDGTAPVAGKCRFPFYTNSSGVRDFNCINSRNSQPPQLRAGSVDGRVYNTVARTSAGIVLKHISGNLPESATWRYNQSLVKTGIVQGGPVEAVCQQASAKEIVGCAVAETNCCITGLTDRREAVIYPYDDSHEPFRLGGVNPSNSALQNGQYPLWHYLYLNALNGFENLTDDCLEVGHDPDYCDDQLAIAREFHDATSYLPGGIMFNACAGFVPLEYNASNPTGTGPICIGAQGSAGCGRPADQGCGNNRECTRQQCIPQ